MVWRRWPCRCRTRRRKPIRDTFAAFLDDEIARFVSRFFIDVGAEQLGALAREQNGGGIAIAPAGADGAGADAGDECDFAFEVQHVG